MSILYEEIYKLKNLLRKGWIIRNISDKQTGRVESDAEHTFSMAILALEIMSKEKLNLDELKVLKMTMYHELCEIDAGDHVPQEVIKQEINKEEKYNIEKACAERISRECNMPEILTLWLEFEEGKTREAKFVKAIDKLDAVMQSKIYDKQNGTNCFQKFYEYSKDIIKPFKKHI